MAVLESETIPNSKSFVKYFFFIFVFILSFFFINIRSIEIFGLGLFFAVNLLFCTFMGKELTDGSISSDGKTTEWLLRYGTLIVSLVFSFVSSIMMIMTLTTLQSKFAENNSEIVWSHPDRKRLDDAEILFITITTFIGTTALYVYNSPEDVRKFAYHIFHTVLNGAAGNWLRVVFPIVIIGLGSALYGRLEMPPLEVNKSPKREVCDPKNNSALQPFKESFIKTYWFLFAYVFLVLARPFIEANFVLFGITPSAPFGFPQGDRSLIYGQNPAISILSLLTLGISSLAGANKLISESLDEEPAKLRRSSSVETIKNVFVALFAAFIVLIGLSTVYPWLIALCVLMYILFIIIVFIDDTEERFGKTFATGLRSFLLMPILRWDILYLLAKYAFGFAGLWFAGFSIKYFGELPKGDPCLLRDAHIRQLYIAFIFFLVAFYSFNTLSASNLTTAVTGTMRYLVPPALLVLSSYLVFTTNYFVNMAPKLVVQ